MSKLPLWPDEKSIVISGYNKDDEIKQKEWEIKQKEWENAFFNQPVIDSKRSEGLLKRK